jgi:hypothetical protein
VLLQRNARVRTVSAEDSRLDLNEPKPRGANVGSAIVTANDLAAGCDRYQKLSQDFVADLVVTGHAFRRLENAPDLSRIFSGMTLFLGHGTRSKGCQMKPLNRRSAESRQRFPMDS